MAGRTKRRRAGTALRQREEQNQGAAEADPRRSLLALRATHGIATVLRTQAVRELSRQQGNQFVQRSLAQDIGVTVSPIAVAREEAEEKPAVTVDTKPTYSTYDVTSSSLKGAFKKIMDYAKAHDSEAGSVKWRPIWTMTYDDGGYVSGVTVTARIVKTMPSWKDADKTLSAAAYAEWQRVYKELDAHEDRHLEILTNGATYIGNSALGSSKKTAEKAAKDAKDSVNADNVAIDPFDVVMTTDIE